MRGIGGTIAALGAALLLGVGPAAAQTAPPIRTSIGDAAADRRPVVINANELVYDRERGTVTARGDVVIFQGDRVVLADEVVFDQRANRVVATGNVTLTEPGAPSVFASRAELTRDMKDGVMEQFRMLFPDDSKLAANGAIRVDGRRNEMSRVVFSPCRLCPKDPTRAPLWQLRARRVVHDQEKRDIIYRNAALEVFGVPVIWTPYLSHPDPTVRRRTGFLTPTFGQEGRLGQTLRVPYFIVIDQDKDATITPLLTTRQRVAMFGEYRMRFPGGALFTDGSITYVRRTDEREIEQPGNEWRGHFFGRLRYDIDNNWRTGVDGAYVTDKTYLRRYNVFQGDTLVSTAFTEGFFDRNYARGRLMHFRTLRQGESQDTLPYVLPLAEFSAVGDPVGQWGRWHFDTSLLALGRDEGVESRRLSMRAGWRLPYTDRAGWLLTVTGNINADFYLVTGNDVGTMPTFSGTLARVYPQVKVDWRYPFARELGNVRHVVEPRVALVASTPKLNTWRIPNEDSLDLELDDTTIFEENRYPGRDRVDDGMRIVYGLNNSLFANRGGKAEVFIGQSYRFFGEDNFTDTSGLRHSQSDLVARVRISPGPYFSLVYRLRASTKFENIRRQEVVASGGIPALRASVSYIDLNDEVGNAEFSRRRQVHIAASSQITPNWSVAGGASFDLVSTRPQPFSMSFQGQYQDECCTIRFTYIRSIDLFTDTNRSQRFLLSIALKYLGEIRTSR
jgi:LPS-assembly protein